MRLLNIHTLKFADYHFEPDQVPKYVIASHRWSKGAEATLEDVQMQQNTKKTGYKKVLDFARYVKSYVPEVDWIWIDTCCIDNRNSQEVSTAINSVLRWYARAEFCLAYLPDVEAIDLEVFRHSEWWTRGWTLQELLAPNAVVFLTKDWQVIGHKGRLELLNCTSLTNVDSPLEVFIASFTGIPANVLRNYGESRWLSLEEKLTWAAGRKTSREEDMSYCLLGLLDVAMVANYGEGGDRARRRLLKEISEDNNRAGNLLDTSATSSISAAGSSVLRTGTASLGVQDLLQHLLAGLYFPQLGDRRDQIDVSYHGTYTWALLSTSTTDAP